MLRFTAAWYFNGVSFTDLTQALGDGTASQVLNTGDKLYVRTADWLSGIYLAVSGFTGTPAYVVEEFDGDTWQDLPLQEAYTTLATGYQRIYPAYALQANGVAQWGASPFNHQQKVPNSTFPESAAPPDTNAGYWTRLRITSGTVTITRALPRMFNTYADVDGIAAFMGLESFADTSAPTRAQVRTLIADAEDWLENWTRKSLRLSYHRNDDYQFQPYGVFLNYRPGWEVVNARLWSGNGYQSLVQGRTNDFYFEPVTSRFIFTLPSFNVQQYSYLLSRNLRMPNALQLDWVSGGDFQTDPRRNLLRDIVQRIVAVEIITSADWTGVLASGVEHLSPDVRVRQWYEKAQKEADELRGLITY